jgi:transcriptional regulator with XRE-family HTH domain
MDIRRRVGQNIKREREAKGWSQEELAFQSGLHRTYVSGLERAVRNPTVTVLEKIAIALGVRTGSLIDAPER